MSHKILIVLSKIPVQNPDFFIQNSRFVIRIIFLLLTRIRDSINFFIWGFSFTEVFSSLLSNLWWSNRNEKFVKYKLMVGKKKKKEFSLWKCEMHSKLCFCKTVSMSGEKLRLPHRCFTDYRLLFQDDE